MGEAQDNHWNVPTTAENSQRTYHDTKDMISSISACRCSHTPVMTSCKLYKHNWSSPWSHVSNLGSLPSNVSHLQSAPQAHCVHLPGNTILQHLLAWGSIVDTNTNHISFTALPALQPLMTFPVTSRNIHTKCRSASERLTKWTTRAGTTCQTSCYYGRKEQERVGEHSDDVKNDLLIIHYLPALLMRWRLLNN